LIKVKNEKVYILIEEEKLRKEAFEKIKNEFMKHKGHQEVYLCTRKERQKFSIPREFWIDVNDEILEYLKDEFGRENIKVQ